MRSFAPAVLLALGAAAEICLDEGVCLSEEALQLEEDLSQSLKLLQVRATGETMPYLQCEEWCKKYLDNPAWLKKYPTSGPKICKKYVGCRACDYCEKQEGATAKNVSYEVAVTGKSCGDAGYRSLDDPEACRDWCSSHDECLAYITYENSNCGKCVGVLHHDCSATHQTETKCTGTITAYNKLAASEGGVAGKGAGNFQCVMSAADPHNACDTAFASSIADKDDKCAENGRECKLCGGHWCAEVKEWDSSAAGSSENSCVTGFSDSDDGCSSAYKINGLAKNGSYCLTSKEACINCKGFWCKTAEIEYDEKAAQGDADANADDDASLPDADEDDSLPGFD
eukprot:TRINITY_DN5026_c0_g1_i2.p1 TRINITY_DN5026_c0_g1~~TRINITY_DN5026_c0_g1_i2.p1  ORF type:complete len:341 (+),score=89.68 TRINITY_DN5026_c0_g1_i2:98-1120(+)